ncbi:MAG: protein kinase domain-containing protein, partial [Planctomycetota bacterium]
MAQLGPYELLGELGRGAMGVVYRARHTALDRVVALKVVVPGSASPMGVARLRREAQAAARLAEVPGVVAVRDVGEVDGTVYVAMDFVDGRAFDAVLSEGELTVAQRVEVVARAARAVHAAHAHGVLHRDLKPANILIARDGEP